MIPTRTPPAHVAASIEVSDVPAENLIRAAAARGCSPADLMQQIVDAVLGESPTRHLIDAALDDR